MLCGIMGTVEEISDSSLILRCGAFSFSVFCPLSVLSRAVRGKNISLVTHLHVREDALTLFGFENNEQLELFSCLISVSGIGPKTALDILSAGEQAVTSALENEDISFLTNIKGIGKKTAQRAILELKGKLPHFSHISPSVTSFPVHEEVITALEGLGWKKQEITARLQKAPNSLDTAEKIIQWFLTNQ